MKDARVEYLKRILEGSRNIVCLLGRGPAHEAGVDFYRADFSYETEEKYGQTPEEVISSIYYTNRPKEFFKFYRESMLLKRGSPDEVNYSLKQMEDDGRLAGIITRGVFNLSSRAGCHNVIHLYGDIDHNFCPHCGRKFDAQYILDHTPIPYCDKCGTMIHPGIALTGEMLDSQVMTKAVEKISSANVLLLLGCTFESHLGSMAKYFNGDKICLVNNVENYSDMSADCVCIGDIAEIMTAAYPYRGRINK